MTRPASTFWPHWPDECPELPHRGPEGPNEDLAQCPECGSISWIKRPPNESYGWHAEDCSLPVDHESFCVGGGSGHPEPEILRGYWPDDPRSGEDYHPPQDPP